LRIETNADIVADKFGKAAKGIARANIKSMKGATLWGLRAARRMAPTKKGALKKGIRRKPIRRKGKIVSSSLVSTVPGSFPYHFWVDEVPGYKYARLAKKRLASGSWPTRAIRNRWPRIYTKRMLYRQTKHSGVPGYFNKTALLLSKKFPLLTFKNLSKTLKIVEVR